MPAWADEPGKAPDSPDTAELDRSVDELQERKASLKESLSQADSELQRTQDTLAETEEARDSARAEVAEQADRIAGL
ncbi:hypothetical protein, partial [Thioalkalivibrio sp. ALJT]|uniref:hypothetical protein n=1 Tax=Thioalkalivibrio sp. ALJT TaxID=1158146 RepID=UPI0005709CAA